MQRPGGQIAAFDELPIVGLARERESAGRALQNCESLLLLGAAGSGKTRILREALGRDSQAMYLPWESNLHRLLLSIGRLLIHAGHDSFLSRAGLRGDSEAWLKRQTSVHLKGLLWNALEQSPAALILDGITGAGFPTYRFVQRLYYIPGMAVIAAARDVRALGALARLFWDPGRTLRLAPLGDAESAALFDMAVEAFDLGRLEIEDFRHKVLRSAKGNPGEIVEMCRLATQPQYVSGRYIKFAPLRIDTVVRFSR